MNFVQGLLHNLEEGNGRIVMRIVPFLISVAVLTLLYDLGSHWVPFIGQIGGIYHGLNDEQSMDNAQVARQIYRGAGFTTEFLRPAAISQLAHNKTVGSILEGTSPELFPSNRFPPGMPRILPDTYNAPGYPYLLAGWFHLVHPAFDETAESIGKRYMYSGDRYIPFLNQIFLFLTAALVFILGRRVFDDRVAWIALIVFFLTDLVWQYSITGLATNVLMFLVTALLLLAVEIYSIGEACFESNEASFAPAWIWTPLLGIVLGLACLTRLDLLVLLIPFAVLFVLMPRAQLWLIPLAVAIPVAMVTPWFWHMANISGTPFGSNLPLLHYGAEHFEGDEIYRSLATPNYEQLFIDLSKKQYDGFDWQLTHAWELLGSSPMVILFAASILHHFKRRRAQALRWLILGCAVCLVASANLGKTNPVPLDPWNVLAVLLPAMIVVGTAFFFILIERLNLHLWLLNNLIVIATMVVVAYPLFQTLTSSPPNLYNYPPYLPAYIRLLGHIAHPDEWIATDMPWATAWYGDRPSLWLPDKIGDFEDLYDNVCPSAFLLITPVTLSKPAMNLTSGEDKEWFPFITGVNVPADFPLDAHAVTANGLEYFIWSTPNRH